MPCRDDYPIENTVAQETYDTVRAELSRIKKRLDKATRVACELANNLNVEELSGVSKEAQAWVKEHREADAKRKREEEERERRDRAENERRVKREKDRLTALNKLSKEERRILGLPDPA
jgi:hypothetical protein